MSIENGYCTLAEFKSRWRDIYTYTATTISFNTTDDSINDSAGGLKRFQGAAHLIEVSGSTSNNGVYKTEASGTHLKINVEQNLTTEAAGDTVTIAILMPEDDDAIEGIIEAASRALDEYLGRVFYTSSTTARYFTALSDDTLFVDDLISIDTDGLVTDEDGDRTYENTWETTDYILLPANASTDGKPYTYIEVDPYGSYTFPVDVVRGVKITGTWGYAASVPKGVRELCLMISEQVMMRREAIFGVIAAPGGTALLQLTENLIGADPHLQFLAAGVRRLT